MILYETEPLLSANNQSNQPYKITEQFILVVYMYRMFVKLGNYGILHPPKTDLKNKQKFTPNPHHYHEKCWA